MIIWWCVLPQLCFNSSNHKIHWKSTRVIVAIYPRKDAEKCASRMFVQCCFHHRSSIFPTCSPLPKLGVAILTPSPHFEPSRQQVARTTNKCDAAMPMRRARNHQNGATVAWHGDRTSLWHFKDIQHGTLEMGDWHWVNPDWIDLWPFQEGRYGKMWEDDDEPVDGISDKPTCSDWIKIPARKSRDYLLKPFRIILWTPCITIFANWGYWSSQVQLQHQTSINYSSIHII